MSEYKETNEGYVILLPDTKFPRSMENQDYIDFLSWVAAGNTPTPADPLPMEPRIIRDWQFRDRFTSTQLVGVMRAAMAGDDIAATVWLKLSTASDGVDLDSPDNQNGVTYVAATYPELAIDPAVILA